MLVGQIGQMTLALKTAQENGDAEWAERVEGDLQNLRLALADLDTRIERCETDARVLLPVEPKPAPKPKPRDVVYDQVTGKPMGSMNKLAALLGEKPAQVTAPNNVQRNTALVKQMLAAAGIDPSIVDRGREAGGIPVPSQEAAAKSSAAATVISPRRKELQAGGSNAASPRSTVTSPRQQELAFEDLSDTEEDG